MVSQQAEKRRGMNPRWSTPIADDHGGEILRWYEGLEAQVMDFIRVVPPHGDNLEVWSPKLATILVDACCLIESIFHQFKDDAATEQPEKQKPSDRPNFRDYAELYSSLLGLPKRTAILLTDTPAYRTPFDLWRDLLGGAPYDRKKHEPKWWDLYNKSKHRRMKVFPEFTLTRTIDALAGALVVISTVPAFTQMMVRHEWLPLDGEPEGFMQDFQQTLRGQHSTSRQWPFTIVTPLFALPIGHGQLPDDIRAFRPLLYGASPRLFRHFGKS